MLELFLIGLAVGFLYYEVTGISPGGVVAPAYCALYINEPGRLVATVIVALAVWLIISLLSRYLIIFGRRRLLLAILVGFLLKLAISKWLQPEMAFEFNLQSIGYIIPGLIANEMMRQKVVITLSSLGIVSVLTYLVLLVVR
ncbi:MAG TPA: poly-gamma-glutamate biosynthesis protein PgsC [candidate division Zixibacteria bacterium]|nr:poly-gamma-glutamate biosynthesis protein PgsC [candidate division Zixibacteria bacterium]